MISSYEEPDGETLSAQVLRVFDGDGFLAGIPHPERRTAVEVSVRCGFIDSPEMEQPGGKEAKAFLSSLIADRWVELAILIKMDTRSVLDRHGRVICVPYLIEPEGEFAGRLRNIELEMVLNGWAWVLERYEPGEQYLDALSYARQHRRGVWAFDNNVHPGEFKRRKYAHRRPMPRRQGDLFD